MPTKRVLLAAEPSSEWPRLLQDCFEEMPARIMTADNPLDAAHQLDSGCDLVLIEPKLASKAFVQKLHSLRELQPALRVYALGQPASTDTAFCDHFFSRGISLEDLEREMVRTLPLPDPIDLLVADDEVEIGAMIQDFLSYRTAPAFKVTYVQNGEEALKFLKHQRPHIVVLDVKMPVKDGIEVYREIQARKLDLPVIVFFDAVSGQEIEALHEIGRPSIVEKASRQSALPELLTLLKKMVYFWGA